jgi:hypothetical protein
MLLFEFSKNYRFHFSKYFRVSESSCWFFEKKSESKNYPSQLFQEPAVFMEEGQASNQLMDFWLFFSQNYKNCDYISESRL